MVGCNAVDKMTGNNKDTNYPKASSHSYATVSCCRESTGGYPATVPFSHQQFCSTINDYARRDQPLNGTIYIPMSVDCGNGHHMIGDEYYQGFDR